MEVTYDNFVAIHEASLQSSGVPKHLWKTLFVKVCKQTFDAGEAFGLAENAEPNDSGIPRDRKFRVLAKKAIAKESDDAIWLVDHCWTWRGREEAAAQLASNPGLPKRITSLMEIENESAIVDEMWRWCQTYQLTTGGVSESLWYVLDEFGSKVRHSGDPNFVLVPFFCQLYGYSISLLFPRRPVREMDEVTRDFCHGVATVEQRRVQMYPWVKSKLSAATTPPPKPAEFFATVADKLQMTMPSIDPALIPMIEPPASDIKVFVDETKVFDSAQLGAPFTLVSDRASADILWLRRSVCDFASLFDESPQQLVNSFPFDFLLTVSVDLCQLARRSGGIWMAPTFDIITELENFIAEFERRAAEPNANNTWILKGLNAPVVTRELNEIVRFRETNRPILIQEFVSNQLLLDGKAFSYSYFFIIKSVDPLEAFVIDIFQGRMSSGAVDLDSLHKSASFLTNDDSATFGESTFDEYLKGAAISEGAAAIKAKSVDIIRAVVLEAISRNFKPPAVIGHYPQSRGFYAANFIVDTALRPLLLNVTFNPPTQFATTSDPEFLTKLFKTLFCDDLRSLPLIDLNA